MITVTPEFQDQINNGNRNYLIKVGITLSDRTVIPILTNDDLFECSIEDAVSEDGKFTALGGAVINKATIVLDNSQEIYTDSMFAGASVTLQIGLELEDTSIEYVDRGRYIVDSTSIKGSGIELICLDYMSKFDKSYLNSNIVYPATIQNVINDACTVCGVTFTGVYPDYDYVLPIMPVVSTFREVLSAIGQLTGTFAHVNNQGELYFSWFDSTNLNLAISSDEKIDGVHYIEDVMSLDMEQDDITIAGVRCYIINENDEKYEYHYPSTLTDTDFCLDITNNPFINGGNITVIVDRVGARVAGLTIRKLEASHISNITYEAGDVGLMAYKLVQGNFAYCPFVFTRTNFSINKLQKTVCGIETLLENQSARYTDSQGILNKAQTLANDARKIATNYLSADTTGIMIADLIDGVETPSTATGRNVKIDSDSVDIRNGQEVLASFGELVTIGKQESTRVTLSKQKAQFIDINDITYFLVEDLRDDAGWYEFTVSLTGDGTNSIFFIDLNYTMTGSFTAKLANQGQYPHGLGSVEVDGVEKYAFVTTYSYQTSPLNGCLLEFDNYTPPANSTIIAVIKTNIPIYKSFMFGTRVSGSTKGRFGCTLGYELKAEGAYSFAIGYGSQALGDYSYAEGMNTVASGICSHAEGGNYGHASDIYNLASGNYSHSEGECTVASGNASHAEGQQTIASGICSHAEGKQTIASGICSHAEGGDVDHLYGGETIASGDYSHAGGYRTEVSGDYSFVHGNTSVVSGSNSVAFGVGLQVPYDNQFVIGQYNKPTYSASNYPCIFVIGNGTADDSSHRKNLLEVYNSGLIKINGSINITGDYMINGHDREDYLVHKYGDTMTGQLMLYYTNPVLAEKGTISMRIDADALTANQRIGGIFHMDSNEQNCFYSETYRTTDNITYTSFVHRRYSSDGQTAYINGFYLDVLNDGNPRVRFTDNKTVDAWRKGLGMGYHWSLNSNLGQKTGTGTALTSIYESDTVTIPKGTYLVGLTVPMYTNKLTSFASLRIGTTSLIQVATNRTEVNSRQTAFDIVTLSSDITGKINIVCAGQDSTTVWTVPGYNRTSYFIYKIK